MILTPEDMQRHLVAEDLTLSSDEMCHFMNTLLAALDVSAALMRRLREAGVMCPFCGRTAGHFDEGGHDETCRYARLNALRLAGR